MFPSTFIPPISTKENAHKWYEQGYTIVDTIVNTRQELIQDIKEIIKNEIDLLEKESQIIRVKIKTKMYKFNSLFYRIKFFKLKFIIMNKQKLLLKEIFNHYSKSENSFYKNQLLIKLKYDNFLRKQKSLLYHSRWHMNV